MDYFILAGVIIGSYLIGSISFTRIVAKRVIPNEDVENLYIGIEGTSSQFHLRSVSAGVLRQKAGSRYGCMTSILDMLKAAVPTLILRLVFPDQPYYLFAAAFAVVGHNFPIYYRFFGGRGMSSIYGGLFVIDWLTIPVTSLLGSLLSVVAFRYIPMMYSLITLLMIPWLWFRHGDWPHMMYAAVINLAFWFASYPDLVEYAHHKKNGDFDQDHYFIQGDKEQEGSLAKWKEKRRGAKRRKDETGE